MLLKSLKYYWRIHLAVLAGAAVTTAVLTGALLVGDSVRGSLRNIVLERLGRIEFALVSEKFVREDLASDLEKTSGFKNTFDAAVPAISVLASVVQPGSGARATGVSVHGIDSRMAKMFSAPSPITEMLAKKQGQIFPSVVFNQTLQKELGVKVGSEILLSLQKPGDIHPETVLGDRDVSAVVRKLRLTLNGVLPDRGPGGFTLLPNQVAPQNVFVDLRILQRALDSNGKVNTFFVSSKKEGNLESLNGALSEVFRFTDTNLRTKIDSVESSNPQLVLESSEIIINPRLAEKSQKAARDFGAQTTEVFTYLANTISTKGRTVPYSTITALSQEKPSKQLLLQNGNPAPVLKDDEILLNEWTAKDLNATPRDEIEISYYVIAAGNQLITKRNRFRLAGVLAMKGFAANSTLAPEYPGIQNTDDISDWSPPFPVDLNLIRPIDEEYWDLYRAAPKAFVSLKTGQRLWGSRFGNLTSIRISLQSKSSDIVGGRVLDPLLQKRFEALLQKQITPEDVGLQFQAIRKQGLEAANGSTDFGALFTGFSFFLIISAAMLAGLLFRLGAEQRSPELGTLLAMGYPPHIVSRRLLFEGFLLATAGIIVGTAAAMFYAWLMLNGLRTWWQAAVGASYLELHTSFLTLLIGASLSLFAMLFSLWWSVRRLSKLPVPVLLVGSTVTSAQIRPSKWSRITSVIFLILGLSLIGIASVAGIARATALFFGAGACLLISSLAFLTSWLHKTQHKQLSTAGVSAAASMAARNTARNPGRSLLSAALVACACFVIVSVAVNRRELKLNLNDHNSGTGGYQLVAQSTLPLLYDPSHHEGLQNLGVSDKSLSFFDQVQITSFRLLPGEDASCLNLYRPEKPRILGVSQKQIERGGFEFQQTSASDSASRRNPWRLLEQELEPGVVPAFGDYNSIVWILHLGLGKDLVIPDSSGKPLRLRFVGLLKGSVFQSEILVSEKQFLKNFPGESGYSYFLIDIPSNRSAEVSVGLEEALADYGFDTKSTGDVIKTYHAVESTYLSTFQTIGGLGLLLGTTGLGIILVRNVIERRGELAAMRAFGFQRKFLTLMVLAENAFLLFIGVLTGTAAAAITAAPHLMQDLQGLPWASLILTLLLVLIVGMISSIAAVSTVLRIPLLPALKAK